MTSPETRGARDVAALPTTRHAGGGATSATVIAVTAVTSRPGG
ncbi:hypothetical protein [Streptomyces agglomeratus]|nr:hypothetical protein [Streptomyces agglomeratus]